MDNAILNQVFTLNAVLVLICCKTLDTALLIFGYSTAEYWSRICCRSTWFIYSVLNEVLRVVTDASIPLKRTTYDFFQTSSHLTFENYM